MFAIISSPLNIQTWASFIWIVLLALQEKHQGSLGSSLFYSFLFLKNHDCCYANYYYAEILDSLSIAHVSVKGLFLE